jgi:hypothetical protein
MVDLNQESVIFTLFMCVFLAFLSKSPYLCNVFFIVLDLRLTKVGTWRSPFFCALIFRKPLVGIV